MKSPSMNDFLVKSLWKQSAVVFTAMVLIALIFTYFLSRYKMAEDLSKTAFSTAEAFRSRILEGDIKLVEIQMRKLLQIEPEEAAVFLGPDLAPIYASHENQRISIERCEPLGTPCFSKQAMTGRIFLPIFFDEKRTNLLGYFYLVRSIKLDWIFLLLVFSIFVMGQLILLSGFYRITKSSSIKLASEVKGWAMRLRHDPKNQTPLSEPPFSELIFLKEAIEGLNDEIKKFENQAGDRAKLLTLRGIAHDLLTPVSQVQLYLACIENDVKGNPLLENLCKEMKSSLRKVAEIASQVKNLNEITQLTESTNLIATVQTEVELLRKSKPLVTKAITIKLVANGSKDIFVSMAPHEVSRIVQNLIENAVQASTHGSEIVVEIDAQHDHCRLSVNDSGHGIPLDLHKRVFDSDYTSKPATGTGLGLYVVKHLCEQRNGSVNLSSEPGKGTRIDISLPVFCKQGEFHAL